jgi:hypothetical protein
MSDRCSLATLDPPDRHLVKEHKTGLHLAFKWFVH